MKLQELRLVIKPDGIEAYACTLWGWHYKKFAPHLQISAITQAIECEAEDVSKWPGYSQ